MIKSEEEEEEEGKLWRRGWTWGEDCKRYPTGSFTMDIGKNGVFRLEK